MIHTFFLSEHKYINPFSLLCHFCLYNMIKYSQLSPRHFHGISGPVKSPIFTMNMMKTIIYLVQDFVSITWVCTFLTLRWPPTNLSSKNKLNSLTLPSYSPWNLICLLQFSLVSFFCYLLCSTPSTLLYYILLMGHDQPNGYWLIDFLCLNMFNIYIHQGICHFGIKTPVSSN